MDLHVTKLEIVAIVRTIEQLDPRVWRYADTSRPCAFLSENVIRTQSTKVRPQLNNARISKYLLDDRFRLPTDAKFDHLGE